MINKDTYKRLTYRFNKGIGYIDNDFNGVYYSDCIQGDSGCITKIYERLAELEDKIENGTLLELPCKVGDKVWWVNQYSPRPRIEEYEVSTITIGKDNKIYLGLGFSFFTFMTDEVYYTKAEAEARLKELQEKEQ